MKLRDLDNPLQTILIGIVLTIAMLYPIAMREGHFFFPEVNYEEIGKQLQTQKGLESEKTIRDTLAFGLESQPIITKSGDNTASQVAYALKITNRSNQEIRLNIEMYLNPDLLDPQNHYSAANGVPDDTPPLVMKPNDTLVCHFTALTQDTTRMTPEELKAFYAEYLKFNVYARINGKKHYGHINFLHSDS